MKKRIIGIGKIFSLWVIVFISGRLCFLSFCNHLSDAEITLSDWILVVLYGLPFDAMTAIWFTVPACILLCTSNKFGQAMLNRIWKTVTVILAACTSLFYIIFIISYPYWGIPLDTLPIQLFENTLTSQLFKSLNIRECVAGIGLLFILTSLIFATQRNRLRSILYSPGQSESKKEAVFYILCLAAIIVVPNPRPIYFSSESILNHATVNPVFSFFHSVKGDLKSEHTFIPHSDAAVLSQSLLNPASTDNELILNCSRPDIFIILLESFSMNLWETAAIPNLKAIADSGLFFTNFYSNSFRTEKAIFSILGGMPSTPNSCLIQYPDKARNIPSFSQSLSRAGYSTTYYFGNHLSAVSQRKSFIENQGYAMTTLDDFPENISSSVWGITDAALFSKVTDDIGKYQSTSLLCCIQTSSSHEPFDVPYHHFQNEKLNAFAYTDSCIGSFVNSLKTQGRWGKSLVILVADHYGCYPDFIPQDSPKKFHIPCIWTGGAVDTSALNRYRNGIPTPGSQQDIAATLSGQLDVPHDDIIFSKDLFNPNIPHFAFFTMPDIFGMVTDSSTVIFDNRAGKTIHQEGVGCDSLVIYGQAYLQRLYDEIEKL